MARDGTEMAGDGTEILSTDQIFDSLEGVVQVRHTFYTPEKLGLLQMNDLQRTRLSRCLMIWLIPPLPLASCFSYSVFLCVADRTY